MPLNCTCLLLLGEFILIGYQGLSTPEEEVRVPFARTSRSLSHQGEPRSQATGPDARQAGSWHRTAQGQPFPSLCLPDTAGVRTDIATLRGRYVLVTLWQPGRLTNEAQVLNFQKLARQFGPRGLVQVHIACASPRRLWQQSVRASGLPGTHLRDMGRGKQKRATELVDSQLPLTLLISPDGYVLARNLHGRALGEKIAEYIPLD